MPSSQHSHTHLINTPHTFTTVSNGDTVEVFWESEDTWFEGEVVDVDSSDGTFLVHYYEDNEEVWHVPSMPFRLV